MVWVTGSMATSVEAGTAFINTATEKGAPSQVVCLSKLTESSLEGRTGSQDMASIP